MNSHYVKLLSASLRAGDLNLVRLVLDSAPEVLREPLVEIFTIEVKNAYQDAITNQKIGVLTELGNQSNWNLGDPFDEILKTAAVLNLREAVQQSGATTFSKVAFPLLENVLIADVNNPVSLDGGIPTISIDEHKYRYGSLIISSPDASVKLWEMLTETGELAVLEIVDMATLKRKSFETLDSWKGYLKTQVNNGLTFPNSSVEYDKIVQTIYRVQEGFHTCQGRSKSVPVGRRDCVPPELIFNC